MAEDYQANAGGILNPMVASQMGAQQSSQAIQIGQQAQDHGQAIQQQIVKTQSMQDQLKKQMQDNHDQMVAHIGQQANQLASADDDDKKGPVWKMQADDLTKKMQSMGMQVDPDVLTTYMKDPTHSGKFSSALAAVMDPKSSPSDQAKALSTLHDNFSSMDEAIKAPDELMDAKAKVLAAGNKVNNTFQTRADKVRDQVKGINQKWDTTEQFTDNALNILGKPGLAQTGPGQTMLQEAYTRSGSGSAIRSFTLQLGQENRSLANKMSGALDKLETGAKLQPDELKAMGEGLKIFQGNANKYRDNEASPYYSSAKGIVQGAQASGYSIKPSDMLPDDQWSRLADKEQLDASAKNAPAPPTKKPTAPAASYTPYQPGNSKEIDNFIKSTIASGATKDQVNKLLVRKKMAIDNDTYNSLKGGQ
jgi:hypothetical protein